MISSFILFHGKSLMITLLLFSYYQSLSGRKEDRIAVCVTSPGLKEDMFLGSPVVTSSVGNVKNIYIENKIGCQYHMMADCFTCKVKRLLGSG